MGRLAQTLGRKRVCSLFDEVLYCFQYRTSPLGGGGIKFTHGSPTMKAYLCFKRPLVLAVSLMLTSCGGGGGSGEAPIEINPGPTSVQFALSGDARVDDLLTPPSEQFNWNAVAPNRPLFYTFSTTDSSAAFARSREFNETQRGAARAVLAQARAVSGIEFKEVSTSSAADLHFVVAETAGYGQVSWAPSNARPSVYIALDRDAIDRDTPADIWGWVSMRPGDLGFVSLLHEVGHALGLKHPAKNVTGNPVTEEAIMIDIIVGSYPAEFQARDLRALYWIYGGDGLGGEVGFNSRLGPQLPPTR